MMFYSWDKSSNKKVFRSCDKTANTMTKNVFGFWKCFWISCAHSEYTQQSWKWAEGGMTEPGHCHRYPSTLFSWLTGWRRLRHSSAPLPGRAASGLPWNYSDDHQPYSLSWKQQKQTPTPRSSVHRAWKTWTIWALFLTPCDFKNVLGYFDAVAFYKYLAVMSSPKKKSPFWRGSFPMCQCCRCFETSSRF